MRIYTAQIGRGGSGLILDTTVKSGAGLGKILAPTWDLVWGVKKGHLSHEEYEGIYLNLLRERFRINKDAFLRSSLMMKSRLPATVAREPFAIAISR